MMSLTSQNNNTTLPQIQNKNLYEQQKPLYTIQIGRSEVDVINRFDVLRGVEPVKEEDVYEVIFTSSPEPRKPRRYAKDAKDVRDYIASKCGCNMTNIFSVYCQGLFGEDFIVKP